VVALGRSVESEAQLRTAAEAGAQAAALERTQSAAEAAARRVVDAMLVNDLTCPDHADRVRVPDDPSRGVGLSAGLVEVVVTCTASDRGIERVATPVTRSITAYATVDRFRASGGG
jgi:Flp pilus assembly protein TadG